MYIPTYWQAGSTASRAASLLSLRLVTRLRRVTFVIHEPDPLLAVNAGRRESIEFRILEAVRRRLWARAGLVFHTEWERQRFAARYPGGSGRIERIVDHSAGFVTTVAATKPEARRALELPADRVILLMIGFFSPHKRFERGIEAVARAGRADLELHIVGSPISDWAEVKRCAEDLRTRARQTPDVHLHERFVSDEEFDVWIRAADAVLVPYTSAASSGVVARTQVVGTLLISSGAGGIAEQLTDDDLRFDDDTELVEIIRRLPAPAAPAHGIASA
jgi:glycosyltransferase involved in cell wall biosynthesis